MSGTSWVKQTFKTKEIDESIDLTPEKNVGTVKGQKPVRTAQKNKYNPLPMKTTPCHPRQKLFGPGATSTPIAREKEAGCCSTSTGDKDSDLSPKLQSYIKDMMDEFKEEAMQEIRRLCSPEDNKRNRMPKRMKLNEENDNEKIECIEQGDSTDEEGDQIPARNANNVVKEEENDEEEGNATEQRRQVTKKTFKPTDDKVVQEQENSDQEEDESSSKRSEVEHCEDQSESEEEKEAEQVESPTPVGEDEEEANEEQRGSTNMREEEKRAVVKDAEKKMDTSMDTTNRISDLLEGNSGTDMQLAQIATSSEAALRNNSFQLSPLRARISTLTVLEVFKVNEEEEPNNDKVSFRVLEEADGNLKMCHNSAIDLNDWSTSCTVNAHETTLEDEIESINKRDIVEACKEGEPLSPMIVSDISSLKKTFKSATIFSKGRAIKTLFRRKDEN